MDENIKIFSHEKKVILSEQMLEKIKYLVKKDSFYFGRKIKDYKREMSYSFFSDVTDYIINNSKLEVKYILSDGGRNGINIDRLFQLKSKYLQLSPIKDDNNIIYSNKGVWYKYLKKNRIDDFCELIDIIYEMTIENKRYHLTIDLISAKEDCLVNMKYFMNEEEINAFNIEYENAILEKDIQKMVDLLNNVQQLILKEWDNYLGNVENMTDDNFIFIGHSTRQTCFDKEFYSRYVSCSLYTEDINDTYACAFGFIMGTSNIVGANSKDMFVNNYAIDQETLLNYSSIKKIDHPRRIIDECLKQKEENLKEKNRKAVYSEVVKDGFEPIGIFCFTDGTKGLNWNYRYAQKLQRSFPNLKIKTFDIMKRKRGIELDEMKLNLLNSLRSQLTSYTYDIQMNSLPRYDIFFEKFEQLKKTGDYTEKDIEILFKYNLELLSIFSKTPDELFNGNYDDIEIKYILGKNVKYNIDYILNGEMKAFSLNELKELYKYKDKLNNYYSGLGEFVELLSKVEVTDDMVQEIKQIEPLNFYNMSKYLTNILINTLNNKEEQLIFEINKNKNKYLELTKEKEYRQEIEKKYQLYSKIILNSYYVDFLKKDYQELNNQILYNKREYDHYVLEKEKIVSEIELLIKEKNKISISNYQSSEEYQNIQSDIEKLKTERDFLKKHPIINIGKIMIKNKSISLLEVKQKGDADNYNANKQENINNINYRVNELNGKIQYIEEQIIINRKIGNELQMEMKNLQNKIYEYFGCYSVLEIDNVIKEAKDFREHYDYYDNIFSLNKIEIELKKIERKVLEQENDFDDIREEKKKIGKF